jgi:hypothetical protein
MGDFQVLAAHSVQDIQRGLHNLTTNLYDAMIENNVQV